MLAHQIPVILGGRFDPSVIFAEMRGAWLEPRVGQMWQENTGATPTTSSGQTIGLLLDQSQGAVIGPELLTNGDFSSGATGWTYQGSGWSISAGVLNVNTAVWSGVYQSPSAINTGGLYQIQLDVARTSGSFQVYFPTVGGNATISASGRRTVYIPGNGSTPNFNLASDAFVGTIDNISVRQVLGNHASQSTAANRPTLQYINGLPVVRCDSNDFMTVYLPNLGSGVFSNSGSVYFATPQGMSALHNQSIGTSYSAPIQSMDLYGAVIVPARLSDQREAQLQTYFEKLAGLR